MVFIASRLANSEAGGRGSGASVSVARTQGETPISLLFQLKFRKYFLVSFLPEFRAIRFHVGRVLADVAHVEATT
jgi:hypothetical protein